MFVSAFYNKVFQNLAELNIHVHIWQMPVELTGPIQPFSENTKQASYDPDAVRRHWQILLQVHRVFTRFRAHFIGKVTPVHFFWGAFDLAVTGFSGKTAPKHPGGAPNCADWVMEEAYSHEVSSAGFWEVWPRKSCRPRRRPCCWLRRIRSPRPVMKHLTKDFSFCWMGLDWRNAFSPTSERLPGH